MSTSKTKTKTRSKKNSKGKPDKVTREAQLKLLNVSELKKIHNKLSKKSSSTLVSSDALINAILKKEYPSHKSRSSSIKKRKESMDKRRKQSTDKKDKANPVDRQKELNVFDQAKLKKIHYRLTKSSSLTYSKKELINSIMTHEHPEFMLQKMKELEESKEKRKLGEKENKEKLSRRRIIPT